MVMFHRSEVVVGSGESVVEGNVKVRTEVGWVGWIWLDGGGGAVWMVVVGHLSWLRAGDLGVWRSCARRDF